MLVVENNTRAYNWSVGDPVTPLDYHGDVVIVFDPSKSNCAMMISTPDPLSISDFAYSCPKTVLKAIEFSGNNRKRGPVEDTTVYCQELRMYLTQLLQHTNLYCVAIEEPIAEKGAKANFKTELTLTEIRANLLSFFMDRYSVHANSINNWAWKFHSLPEGYRSKYEKGSKKLFIERYPYSPFTSYFEADMTDCIGILVYVLNNLCKNYSVYCSTVEPALCEYNFLVTHQGNPINQKCTKVAFNPTFSIVDNMNYYANRILTSFYFEVPMDRLTYDLIYKHSNDFQWQNISNTNAEVLVCRKS